jgi:hypothetical protein
MYHTSHQHIQLTSVLQTSTSTDAGLLRNLEQRTLRLKLPPLVELLQLRIRHLVARTLPDSMPDALGLHGVLVAFFQRHMWDGNGPLHGALGGDLDEILPRRRQPALELDGVEGDWMIGGGVVDLEDAQEVGFWVERGAPVDEGDWGGCWVVDGDVDGEADGGSGGGRDGREDNLEVGHVVSVVGRAVCSVVTLSVEM